MSTVVAFKLLIFQCAVGVLTACYYTTSTCPALIGHPVVTVPVPKGLSWEAFSPVVRVWGGHPLQPTASTGFFVGKDYVITAGHMFDYFYITTKNERTGEELPALLRINKDQEFYDIDNIGKVQILDEDPDQVYDILSVRIFRRANETYTAKTDFAILKVAPGTKTRSVLTLSDNHVFKGKYDMCFYGSSIGRLCESKSKNEWCLRKILIEPTTVREIDGFYRCHSTSTFPEIDPSYTHQGDSGGPLVLKPTISGGVNIVIGFLLSSHYNTRQSGCYSKFQNFRNFFDEIRQFAGDDVYIQPKSDITTQWIEEHGDPRNKQQLLQENDGMWITVSRQN